MMEYSIFLVLLSLISITFARRISGATPRENMIVGGVSAGVAQYPFTVIMKYDRAAFCTASIISNKFILTAGHCVHDPKRRQIPPYDRVTCVTGTISSTTDGGEVHRVVNAFYHKDFKMTKYNGNRNDIGMFVLGDPIIYNTQQQPIKLPSAAIVNYSPVYVVGWGALKTGGIMSDILHRFDTKVIDHNECLKRVSLKSLDDSHLCDVQTQGTGTCFGDSGGPMISNDVIVGIVSFGTDDKCATSSPDVFTNVFHYMNLIKQWMDTK